MMNRNIVIYIEGLVFFVNSFSIWYNPDYMLKIIVPQVSTDLNLGRPGYFRYNHLKSSLSNQLKMHVFFLQILKLTFTHYFILHWYLT